jgi:hypothetical protein
MIETIYPNLLSARLSMSVFARISLVFRAATIRAKGVSPLRGTTLLF